MGITRREFISTTGKAVTGVGAAAAFPSFVKSMKSRPPSDRVVVGVIGCRGMGWSNLVQFLNLDNVECTALRSEEHTSELQSRGHLVCRLLLEKKNKTYLKQVYPNGITYFRAEKLGRAV